MKFKKINESVEVENKLRGVIDPTYARAIKSRAANKKRADGSMRVARKNTDDVNKRLLKREGLSKRVGNKRSLKEGYYGDIIRDLLDRATGDTDYEEVYDYNLDEVVNDAINDAIDTGLIYDDDIITLASYYGVIDTSNLVSDMYDDIWNDLYSDVYDYAKDHIIEEEEDDNLDEAKKSKTRKPKLTEGKDDFYGVDGVEFIWRGQDDFLVKYKGEYYSYYDLENWLWLDFQEDIKEGIVKIGEDEDEDRVFGDWVVGHPDLVYSALYDLPPYEDLDEGCSKKSTKRRVAKKPINERGLTSAERHNRMMNSIFSEFDRDVKKMKRFLISKGVSKDEVEELAKHTGLGRNALMEKIIEMGLKDEFFSMKESKASPRRTKTLVEKPVMNLRPAYDSRKSFYGKAIVDTGDKNAKNKLYSYGTLVAEIKEDGKPIVYGTYSPTTLRHIKEWLKQNGFKAETSKQIMADYGVR